MPADTHTILEHLALVAAQRERRSSDPALAQGVHKVKDYQQRRFARTYADLLRSERYAAAAGFFLDELYGPHDFTRRDEQFARVVPALVHLFPHEIVETVYTLAQLHSLSETLDTVMGSLLVGVEVDAMNYIRAWQRTGEPVSRERQIALTLEVGASLDRLTRKPLLRHTLHLMRGPARAAGLGELQQFLESGFDTFKAMRGGGEFLGMVGERERALARALFAANLDSPALDDDKDTSLSLALGQLP